MNWVPRNFWGNFFKLMEHIKFNHNFFKLTKHTKSLNAISQTYRAHQMFKCTFKPATFIKSLNANWTTCKPKMGLVILMIYWQQRVICNKIVTANSLVTNGTKAYMLSCLWITSSPEKKIKGWLAIPDLTRSGLVIHICINELGWGNGLSLVWHWAITWTNTNNGACCLAAIAGATILVPCHVVKSLQLIWRSGTFRFRLRVPHLQMSCSD